MFLNLFLFIGGIGGWEVFLIITAMLLLFGAKKIPELAKGLGRGIREFKDATKEINRELESGMNEEPKKQNS
ncbi:MAG: Sec-independent protein translocase subunit TatA/TatB [Thermoflexibacteraceae bacterium]|jgi:sec-independent protein translocase protein TatA